MQHHSKRGRADAGTVLVEFALVTLVFYLLLAGTIDLGRMVFAAQVIQDAARVAARELSVTVLPADTTFEAALADAGVSARIFDPGKLVIDLDLYPDNASLQAAIDSLPVVNRALWPLMTTETVTIGGMPRRLLRYPGALLGDASTPSGFTVMIPRVSARHSSGVETIDRWLPVLEEIRSGAPSSGPFSLSSTGPQQGLAAVRINYPFQGALLSGFMNHGEPFEAGTVIVASDADVTAPDPPAGTVTVDTDDPSGIYAGPYGLGRQLALVQTVRPFRKVLAAQAIFRREVFQ